MTLGLWELSVLGFLGIAWAVMNCVTHYSAIRLHEEYERLLVETYSANVRAILAAEASAQPADPARQGAR